MRSLVDRRNRALMVSVCGALWGLAWVSVLAPSRATARALQAEGPPTTATATQPPVGASDVISITRCQLVLIDDIYLPAQESGPLSVINVREGQLVAPQEELAKIDDRLAVTGVASAEAKRDAARVRADDDVAVRYAQAAYEYAKADEKRNLELWQKHAAPQVDYERSKLAARQAELQIEKSQHDLEVFAKEALVEEMNVRAAHDNLERHIIRSPIEGNVEEILRRPGEWVTAGDKVLRVVRMNRLRVSGALPEGNYNPGLLLGAQVLVDIPQAGGQMARTTGEVVYVGLSRTQLGELQIWAEVDNQQVGQHWAFLPGTSDVTMHIQPPSGRLSDKNP
jgi:multidrug efflux pump subunit AcrA (membrane-fusion protein)